jgi:hypothetical protein
MIINNLLDKHNILNTSLLSLGDVHIYLSNLTLLIFFLKIMFYIINTIIKLNNNFIYTKIAKFFDYFIIFIT